MIHAALSLRTEHKIAADAIEHIFKKDKIQVVRVNTMNYEGKAKRVMGRMRMGKKPNWKKAIVTLKDGDSIDVTTGI